MKLQQAMITVLLHTHRSSRVSRMLASLLLSISCIIFLLVFLFFCHFYQPPSLSAMMLLSLKPLLHSGSGAKKRECRSHPIYHVNLTMKLAKPQGNMSGVTNCTAGEHTQFLNGQEKTNQTKTCPLIRLP